jgi:hypothetical protein
MIQRMKEGAGRELPGEIDRHKQSTGIDVLVACHIPASCIPGMQDCQGGSSMAAWQPCFLYWHVRRQSSEIENG